MRRTEFYKGLEACGGRGQFVVDPLGRLRMGDYDPLSFLAWKLTGLEAPGEIDRPAAALGIKNPLRLVLAADLSRGYVGSTRRALLQALGLQELPTPKLQQLLKEGAQPTSAQYAVGNYDPDARCQDDDVDSTSSSWEEPTEPEESDDWSEPEDEEDS